jgi:hypothetical protein
MGFVVRVGASATGMAQLAAAVCLALLGQACSIEQPVSGPISLTAEWTTIEPPDPLRVAGKNEQKICLQIATAHDIDLTNGVILGNGQRHLLEGEVVDREQSSYGLQVGEIGGDTVCLYRAGQLAPGPDFPADQAMVRLRLRSAPPLQVAKAWWLSYDPH